MEGKGTINTFYMLQTKTEGALEVHKEVYLWFIDFTKAFDKVWHDDIFTLLTQLKIDGKDLQVIKKCVEKRQQQCKLMGKLAHFKKLRVVCAFPIPLLSWGK